MPALDVPYDIIEGYLEEEITMQRATHVRVLWDDCVHRAVGV